MRGRRKKAERTAKGRKQKAKGPSDRSPVSHGEPEEGGKVTPEEAIRIESFDLPSGSGEGHRIEIYSDERKKAG